MIRGTPPAVGAHTILKELGQDGFGIVYEAQDEKKQPILLRVIAPEISNNDNFVVRFELLKAILPSIEHKNLLKVIELGSHKNIFFIAKERPGVDGKALNASLQTLNSFDFTNTSSNTLGRHRTLLELFEGIAQGLSALEQVRKSYYKHGILHNSLKPDNIYIFSNSAQGILSQGTPSPKLDGYAEPFLFFGDGPQSLLHYRMATPLATAKRLNQEKNGIQSSPLNLYGYEPFYPPESRQGLPLHPTSMQYAFGALLYHHISKQHPKGLFIPLKEHDGSLDPLWDEIVNRCLASPHGGGYANMGEVAGHLKKQLVSHLELSPEEKKIKSIKPPAGMALVACLEKVEIGAHDGPENEQPPFRMRIKPFFMDIFPVTFKQFKECMPLYTGSDYSRGDNLPATLISISMAKAYCRWRSEKEGLPPQTYRLPTEYEWEAAARGQGGLQYPWGATQDPLQLYCNKDKERGTIALGQLPAGRFGLHDMLGNVWEWTDSLFHPHPFAKGAEKPVSPKLHVAKGGCWLTPLELCRGSLRQGFAPHEPKANIGFRCARNVDYILLAAENRHLDGAKAPGP